MPTLDAIRAKGEADFRAKLETLDRRHRVKLLAALEQYGHPQFIPDEIWAEIRREQEDELLAAYIILMASGDEWTADELARQGVSVSAASDGAYGMKAARQAQRAATAVVDTLKDRITRRVEDSLASPTGGVGQAQTGELRQAIDDVLNDARRERIAATETTGALTTGQRGAAERIGGDGARLVDGQTVEIEMRWVTEGDSLVCPRCAPLDGQPESVWSLVFPNGPGEEAHENCRCWLDPIVVVRAQESVVREADDRTEGRWVTIRGNAVKISDDGEILTGPLKGTKLGKVSPTKHDREALSKLSDEELERLAKTGDSNRTRRLAKQQLRYRMDDTKRSVVADRLREIEKQADEELRNNLPQGEYEQVGLYGMLSDRSPAEIKAYVAAAVSFKSHDPSKAAIDFAVTKLKDAGINLEQKGDNYSWYGKTGDGRSVRVGDHLGFESHDIDIVLSSEHPMTKKRVTSYIQDDLEAL